MQFLWKLRGALFCATAYSVISRVIHSSGLLHYLYTYIQVYVMCMLIYSVGHVECYHSLQPLS